MICSSSNPIIGLLWIHGHSDPALYSDLIIRFPPVPIHRYATRRSRNLPSHPASQASHDVLRHLVQGHSSDLQEVHAKRERACDLELWPPSHGLLQPLEIYVDDETKLTLHGLKQYYFGLEEKEKNRKLNDLLDNLEFNQVSSSRPKWN